MTRNRGDAELTHSSYSLQERSEAGAAAGTPGLAERPPASYTPPMETRPSGSASVPSTGGAASPVMLRLLPHVHHPPASVLVVGGGGEDAAALDARGYRVALAVHPQAASGRYDLVCESGAFGRSPHAAYVAAVAEVLRPGGKLFGGFTGIDASALIHLVAGAFEVERVDVSGHSAGGLEVVLVRR